MLIIYVELLVEEPFDIILFRSPIWFVNSVRMVSLYQEWVVLPGLLKFIYFFFLLTFIVIGVKSLTCCDSLQARTV